MSEGTFDQLEEYVNEWGARLPETRTRADGQGTPDGELDIPVIPAQPADLRRELSGMRRELSRIQQELSELQRQAEPGAVLQAMHQRGDAISSRLMEEEAKAGGLDNARIRIGRILRRIALDFLSNRYATKEVGLQDVSYHARPVPEAEETSQAMALQAYGPFPTADVALFMSVYRYGLALGALDILGDTGAKRTFAFDGLWEQAAGKERIRLLFPQDEQPHQAAHPLQDACAAISQMGTVIREEGIRLGICRAPAAPATDGGGGVCGRIFVDRTSRGSDRTTCSHRCRSALHRWRGRRKRRRLPLLGYPAGDPLPPFVVRAKTLRVGERLGHHEGWRRVYPKQ